MYSYEPLIIGVNFTWSQEDWTLQELLVDEARTKSSSKRDTEFHTPSCEAKHSPDDVVMLIKQHMRDKHLSQEPMVVLSSERAPPLSRPEQKMPRNPLSEKIVSEYLKTAKHVEQPPWTLKHAASYLREFCDRNQKGEQGEPPHFVFSSIMVAAAQGAVAGMELPIEYSEFATGAPKIVQVVEKPPEGLRKKPCAKAKATCKAFSKPKQRENQKQFQCPPLPKRSRLQSQRQSQRQLANVKPLVPLCHRRQL